MGQQAKELSNIDRLKDDARFIFSGERNLETLIGTIEHMVRPKDWEHVKDTDDAFGHEKWVEVNYNNRVPSLFFCSQSNVPGAAAVRKPVALS